MNTRNDRHVAESERNDATIATIGSNIFENGEKNVKQRNGFVRLIPGLD